MKFPFPKDIMIEVTNECNLRCTTCYSHQDGREKKYMNFEVFKKIVDEIPDKQEKTMSLYNYGEPLMHREIEKFVEYAKESRIGNIKIATNGTFLTRKKASELCLAGLDYLSISVDGITQKSYEEFRKGWNLRLVLKHIQETVYIRNKLKSWLQIELQFIIMSHNQSEIEKVKVLAKKLWVDVLRLKTVLIKEKKWVSLDPKNIFSRYTNILNKNSCQKPKEWIVVNVDGSIIPCCYITDSGIDILKYGNVSMWLLESFEKKESQDFVKKISEDKTKSFYCKDCQEWNTELNYELIYL